MIQEAPEKKESPPPQSPPALELRSVSYNSLKPNSLNLDCFSSTVSPKQFVEVHLDQQQNPHEFIELVVGLRTPVQGTIRACGMDWLTSQYESVFKIRSRIGRVFGGPAWIQNLTVGENIRLAPLHQRIRAKIIQQKLEHWIERLSGQYAGEVKRSLKSRPAFVQEHILQISQLIRAMINDPLVLLLERPFKGIPKEIRKDLTTAIIQQCQSGTAVLWFTDRPLSDLQSMVEYRLWKISHNNMLVNGGVA
jgi:ABC-type multidrug transport system ATPase subunit